MKKFVRIQSTLNISVTPGLNCIDVTNYASNVPERLNVKSTWVNSTIKIKAGIGYYPALIKTWPSVQALVRDNLITVAEETDTILDQKQFLEAEAMCTKLEKEIKNAENEKKKADTNKKRINNAAAITETTGKISM